MNVRTIVAVSALACSSAMVVAQARPSVVQEAPTSVWRWVGSDRVTYRSVVAMAPPLIHRYAEEGIWDWDQLVLDLRKNPFYVRGDFDGDGATDVAVYVLVLPRGIQGLAVLHGSVDHLRLFAKRDSPEAAFFPGRPRIEEIDEGFVGEYLRIRSAGTHIEPFPCSELRNPPGCDDAPFALQHDAFEAHYIGKSSVVFVWRVDRYVRIVTSD